MTSVWLTYAIPWFLVYLDVVVILLACGWILLAAWIAQ